MTCLRCQHGTAKRFGTCGKLRIQRYRMGERIRQWLARLIRSPPKSNKALAHYPAVRRFDSAALLAYNRRSFCAESGVHHPEKKCPDA